MYAVKTFARNAPATPVTRFSPQTIARWLGASALAVGALGFANQSRANDLVWSVGVASPGVRVVVGNAPPVVYQPVVHPHGYPQVYPQVRPQVVYPHVVHPQVVYPHRPLIPFGHARPVVVLPQPVYYNHGPQGRWEQRHRGHGYGQVGAYGGSRDGSWGGHRDNNGGGNSGGNGGGNGHGDNPRQGPGQGGGRSGHPH